MQGSHALLVRLSKESAINLRTALAHVTAPSELAQALHYGSHERFQVF